MLDLHTWYGLLGPIQVVRDGAALDLGPRQRRVLLTRLLIEDGRPVSVRQLCQDLWPGSQPTGAISSIRAHISRLRSVLEPARHGRGTSTVLVSVHGGYALNVPRQARDTTRFEETTARARDLMNRGQLHPAREAIDEALNLWRGEALEDAAEHTFAVSEAARLHTARQDAEELQATILIKQYDLERAISAAERLTVNAPLREAPWALLMRALYTAGRSVEALQHYERFRATLAEQLGLDPSPAIRDLHTAILRHDTDILGEPHATRATVTLPHTTGPEALPLVGRTEQTNRLTTLLHTAAAGRTQWAVLSGEPGTGKTRLLEELATHAADAGFTVARASSGQALGGLPGGPSLCPAAQLLDALRRVEAGTGSQPEYCDGHPKGPAGGVLLGDVVRELTRRPTVCLIDDLHWSPPEFQGLLSQLAAVLRDAPVAVICATRDADGPTNSGLLAELARHDATRLHLDPLSIADVTELLAARGERASHENASRLHHRAEGNPFILSELLKLPPDQRTGPTARVPAAVHSVLHARLAELDAPVRTLLTHAAADGPYLDIALLADVLDMPQDRVLPLVDAAVTAHVLVWEADSPERFEGRYRFPELAREALLNTLTPSSRRLLHASLARALTDRPNAEQARVARHLRAAGPMALASPG